MRNLEDRGVDYPISPDETGDKREKSETVTVCYPERFSPIINPPAAAESHIDDNRHNYSPAISLDTRIKDLLEDPAIDDAMRTGWILPLHNLLSCVLENGGLEGVRTHIEPLIQGWAAWTSPETGDTHMIVTVRTLWVPDVEEGTSLLVTQPHFTESDEYTVLTTLIDPDAVSMYIDVKLMVHKQGLFSLYNNTPIAQVIPVRRSLLRAETEVVDPVAE